MDDKELSDSLKYIRDVAFELESWIDKRDYMFILRIDPEMICIQGAKTNTMYRCVEKKDMDKTVNQIMNEFYSDRGVLKEGLKVLFNTLLQLKDSGQGIFEIP